MSPSTTSRGVGGARSSRLKHAGQLGVDARYRGKLRGAECSPGELDLLHDVLESARLLDERAELAGVARLRDDPMSDRRCPGDERHLAVPGEHDPNRGRPAILYLGEQLRAVGPRHTEIRDDRILRLLGEKSKRLAAALNEAHRPLVATGAECIAQAVEQLAIVVDEQDAPLRSCVWRRTRRQAHSGTLVAKMRSGSRTTLEPMFVSLSMICSLTGCPRATSSLPSTLTHIGGEGGPDGKIVEAGPLESPAPRDPLR